MNTSNRSLANRAWELDALRGLALFMMFGHHLMYDFRYILLIDVFAWQDSWWFLNLLRPLFLNVFLVVSGISSSFSRNNLKRGLRLASVALAFSAVSSLISILIHSDLYIFFNVLHLLAVGTLIYAGLSSKRLNLKPQTVQTVLVFLIALVLYLGSLMPDLNQLVTGHWWTLPLGILPMGTPSMADYLPIFPWLGYFLVGALVGQLAYADKSSRFPRVVKPIAAVARPLAHLGRNSLVYYALHQPIMLGLLYALMALGWLK
ncbi:MAG: heparan-alpha-glucosaminide N-acetyltransferase [Eubacteriales bacterium]|nr:heparan-alpha-glucosaminide N-acetyltransferase [Eubacteriales bacterium]